MGKRSSFERVERDFYPTPFAGLAPLLPHLKPGLRFCEPCAGDGQLMDFLTEAGHHCARAWDIEPQRHDIDKQDATTRWIGNIDCFVTNPPWARPVLHKIIANLSSQAPTWLLFDADWAHTRQAVPYLPWLRKIVAVGRLKWIPDSKFTGKDNCAWHLFDQASDAPTIFVGRT